MSDAPDPPSTPADADAAESRGEGANGADEVSDSEELETLRRRVEEEYDFDDFGPADMAQMEPEEWDAAFDADSWITGEALLDRVEADLQHRVATRDVFAVVERATHEGQPCLIAYTDSGYALVEPDGSVEGFGTVLRDTKPVVALCSMESYDVPDAPDADFLLPHPEEVPETSDELGNMMMQVVAGVLSLAGIFLVLAALYSFAASYGAPSAGGIASAGGGSLAVMIVVGIVFVGVGLTLFATVANARLSDTFRAEEYRERLRNMGLDDGERPAFLPTESGTRELSEDDRGDA
ncbi:DUF7319 domain-containing protein [Salinarchaeum laminariae]|uniref:DUF7319 domain-containing protein n=1 Tax=Salinarchaeum laminariae TaxID=869888 RepID=UPI0020BD6836|nr:hypothetical protein [Salinarchaeum laminariae]